MSGKEETLAERHCPILFLDGREEYHPIDFMDAVIHNRLIEECREDTVVSHTAQRADGGWNVSYFILFAEDTGVSILSHTVSAHKWDIERVDVLLGPDQSITGVVYTPHGDTEDYRIYHPADLEQILVGTRPVVFVGYGKHATNAVPVVRRMAGIANDVCRRPRIRIDPTVYECPERLWRPYNYTRINNMSSIRQRVKVTRPESTRAVRLNKVKNINCLPFRAAKRWFKRRFM